MKKLLFTAACFAAALSVACSDSKDEGPVEFVLPTFEVNVFGEMFPLYFSIESGSKDYEITVADPSVASAEVKITESYPYGLITVNGKKIGKTSMTVRDKVLGESKNVDINVNEVGILLNLVNVRESSFLVPDDISEAIRTEIDKEIPFKYALLSNEEKGIMYDPETPSAERRRFRHYEQDGNYYLEIAGNGDGVTSTRTLQVDLGGNYVARAYLPFFGFELPETRQNMSSDREPLMLFHEDLTEYYRAHYQNADIKEVVVTYVTLFGYDFFRDKPEAE